MGGKTLTRRITAEQAAIYQEWIANRRRALRIIAEIEQVSRQADEILLEEGTGPAARGSVAPPLSNRCAGTTVPAIGFGRSSA